MRVHFDKRTEVFLRNLSIPDTSRITRTIEAFEKHGFSLNQLFLKKLAKNIWELRAGRIRLLFGITRSRVTIVHGFVKKTEKTPLKEMKLARKRVEEYQ